MSLEKRKEANGMAKFCEMLRTLRKKENLTQEELAKALGLSPSAIGMYERGQREPNLETLEAFADCFGVSISMLVRGFEEITSLQLRFCKTAIFITHESKSSRSS